MAQKLLLIDGNSLFYRAYHAIPALTDRKGEVANAVFGFSNMLLKAIGEVKPDYVACAFDTKAPTFRHIEFEKYKAQRPPPPADLYPQLPKVKKVLDAFGIKYFEKAGFEADDILATLASKFQISNFKFQITILSSDRDVLQLVNGNVKVQMPSFALHSRASEGKPGWGVLIGASEVREKYGLEPHQMVDYKSLVGDQSDNIPGIAGIGPKTAATLLQKYQTLEKLFNQLAKNPGSLGNLVEKLKVGRDIAIAAKRLVELDRNVDLPLTINDLLFDPDWEKVRAEYDELGFKSIAAKIPGSHTSEVGSAAALHTSEVKESKKQKHNQLELI